MSEEENKKKPAEETKAVEETPVEPAAAEAAPEEKPAAEESPVEEAPAKEEEAAPAEEPAVVAEEAPAEEKPAAEAAEETEAAPVSSEAAEAPAPTIKVPVVEPEAAEDIVASKPDSKERQSAVIGSVDRPMATKQAQGRRGGFGGQRRPGGGRRFGQQAPQEEEGDALFEKVVHINRCAKVVAGGRRFSFAALVVVGDQNGNVGVGYGKAKEVPECIRKGTEQARKNMAPVAMRNNTIPHEVMGEHDGGRILLRPAVPGTGVIAGGGVRAVLEAAGVKDVLTKSLRSNNPGAMVFATLDALQQLRTHETIQKLRKA